MNLKSRMDDVSGKILEAERSYPLFPYRDLHLFLEPVVFLIQPGQCLVNIFHTCDRLFQGKLFRFLPHIDREHCGIIIGQFQRVLIRIDSVGRASGFVWS